MHHFFAMTTAGASTLAAYAVSLRVRGLWRSPLANPVFLSAIIIVSVLAAAHIPYSAYAAGQDAVTAWVGPGCAALGVILYRHRSIMRQNAGAIIGGIVAGATAAVLSSFVLARLLDLSPQLTGVLMLKSVTAAVAVQYAPHLHISPAVVAVVVVAAGVTGAMAGPPILDFIRSRDALARGIALGSISHGIGTAQAAAESELAGAAASLGMCMMALAMSCIVFPVLLTFTR